MLVRKRAIVEKIQGKQLVLSLENGQQLTLLRDELEPTTEVGAEFVIQILPKAEADLEQAELSRILLNQIFDSVDKSPTHIIE
jgi:hypothetical protein